MNIKQQNLPFYINDPLNLFYMEDPNLAVIFIYIQQRDYTSALDLLNATNGHKTIVNLLKTLCLSELGDFTEAEKIEKEIKEISKYFNTIIYNNLNMMEKLRKCISSDKDLYEYYILQEEYAKANTHALNMSNNYRIFSSVMSGEKGIITLLQQETNLNSNMLIFLHRQKACNINSLLCKVKKQNGHFYVLVKEMFTSRTIHENAKKEIMLKNGLKYTNEESKSRFLRWMILQKLYV